jgi:membrane protease YdiL (CAAX protease family)
MILLLVNVIGEEFWWRGLIFPRQELAFGRWVWVIHGVFWALFHSYKYWDLLNQLPLALGLSCAVFFLRKNTPGMAIHFVTNGVGLIPIILGFLGL